MSQAGSAGQKAFDFLKRKRWAELLVTELADGVNFIFSASCTVLYCGPAFTELTGWRDTDLLDRDILEVVTSDDHDMFHACLQESLHKNSEFLAYIRFRRNENLASNSPDHKDILFEVKGHPCQVRDSEIETKVFFATAKPYPSRNTETLDSFLELKIENEQLQRRFFELQNCLPLHPSSSPLVPPPNQVYTTSSIASIPPQRSTALSNLYGPTCWTVFDNPSNSIDTTLFTDETIHPSPPSGDDGAEDGSKKKKLKKSHLTEQYVCTKCGRTDSPEWRKGPRGPKTLCNACGLRWAKQVRKTDDAQGDSLGENN